MQEEGTMPRKFNKKPEKKEKRKISTRKKTCRFCTDKELIIDYKLARQLGYFLAERGKIVPRRTTGNCVFHQLRIVEAISRARVLALLPYTVTHANL
ncbi:MAG TPA: 30S ribosomal protein S18 [Deltaproteobacteria bacterium]|nr:MAG: 30S ribosomal protein S18 [Deltaproteobacteria bacterium GWA2_45_12]HBF12712.1 30S ribosomal protein S18 [Deltaproteobacteria bacterium]